jgi:hypothetical protein
MVDRFEVAKQLHPIRQVSLLFFIPRNFLMSTRAQLPRYLQRYRGHPPSECGELRPMGNRRIHLPICRPAQTLFLVDKVQL